MACDPCNQSSGSYNYITTPSAPPECESEETCKELVDAACVKYTGSDIEIYNIEPNERLNSVVTKLATVPLTAEFIAAFLTTINNDAELKAQFCAICV